MLDLDQMAAISGSETRVLILNNPWDPTGTVFRRQELDRIMAIARDQNFWVISDEIYDSSFMEIVSTCPRLLFHKTRENVR